MLITNKLDKCGS